MPNQSPFDRKKFKSFAHYVLWQTRDRAGFDVGRLHRALWFAEAYMFMWHRKPLTGAVYVREAEGPRARAANAVLRELAREDAIKFQEDRTCAHGVMELRALKPPNLESLTEGDLDAAEWALRQVEEGRLDHAWEIAEIGEVLPYYALFFGRMRQPDEEEMAWVRQRMRELGLS